MFFLHVEEQFLLIISVLNTNHALHTIVKIKVALSKKKVFLHIIKKKEKKTSCFFFTRNIRLKKKEKNLFLYSKTPIDHTEY